jgi:uncharacterized protein
MSQRQTRDQLMASGAILFKRDDGLLHKDFGLTELKAVEDAEPGTITGYASTFGNVDQGGDVVIRGAFSEGLDAAKAEGRLIPMLWQHRHDEPIGIWDEIKEDRQGLKVTGRLLIEFDPIAQRAYGHVKARSIGGMSIGYSVPVGGMEEDPKRRGVYRLTKLDLREASLVTMPMNLSARVTDVKALVASGMIPTEREFEGFLRDAGGFSKKQAERFVHACRPLLRGEPASEVKEADVWASLDRMLRSSETPMAQQ